MVLSNLDATRFGRQLDVRSRQQMESVSVDLDRTTGTRLCACTRSDKEPRSETQQGILSIHAKLDKWPSRHLQAKCNF